MELIVAVRPAFYPSRLIAGFCKVMGRWRPPAKAGKPYITAAGYAGLETELRELWARRNEVVKHLAAAAAEGDRSENAEYIYRKKELREIDRRVGYLQRRMPKLNIVTAVPEQQDKVFFGATVELETEQGETLIYRIVGLDEAQPDRGDISVDSPTACALLGRTFDDEVNLGDQQQAAVIVSITYPSS